MRKLRAVDITVESDRPRVAEQLHRRLGGETDSAEYTIRGLRKDGTVIDIEIYGNAVTLNGRRLLVSLVLDVTARVASERKVRELKDALQDQAVHDQLTGLYNRRFLQEALNLELNRASRRGLCLSAIMADIDYFKAVNDRYGHGGGDEVLRALAQVLNAHVRGSDVCCRSGGEEFLLILPEMTEAAACERAERLRAAAENLSVKVGADTISITVSFGVATYPSHAETADDLIAAADQALYAAKKWPEPGRQLLVFAQSCSRLTTLRINGRDLTRCGLFQRRL
jgi:diguanylate cyclase (GGDEF)-like protein